jgi:hypothetical protein
MKSQDSRASMHSFSSGSALIASVHALRQQANSPRILGRIGLTPNGSLLTLGGICGMPGSSGVTRSGVCDDATSALSCGAGPAGGDAARFDDLFGSLAQTREFREYLAGCWPRGTGTRRWPRWPGRAADRGAASGGPASTDLKVRRELWTGAPPRTQLPCLSPCLGRHDHTF